VIKSAFAVDVNILPEAKSTRPTAKGEFNVTPFGLFIRNATW